MDRELSGRVKDSLESIASDQGIRLDQVILFGSRAREDHGEESDIDLVLISEDFEHMDTPSRSKYFYLKWDYDELPEPEFICFTPEEFAEKKENRGFIAYQAAKEGVEI